jgi:ABC-2 type transport system permease protein
MTALRAEWTKLRTLPGTIWLVAGLVVLTAGVSVATMAATGDTVADPAKSSLIGVTLGQALVAILAVLAVGGEYSTQMMHTTLAAMPRRPVLLTAKAAVVTAVVLLAAAVAVAACVVAGRLMLTGHGPILRPAAGSVLYLALIGLISIGAAVAVRDSATAIGVVLGVLYVLPIVAGAVSDPHWQRHLLQVAPMTAGLAIQATTGLDGLPIGPWAGLGVVALWAAGALLAGGVIFMRRDA